MPKPANAPGKNPAQKKKSKLDDVETYRKLYKKNGRVKHTAPRWARHRQEMESFFPPYYATTTDTFKSDVNSALTQLENTKHPIAECPIQLGDDYGLPDYSEVTLATLEDASQPLDNVITELVELFDGMPNSSHPFSQPNVLPAANKASVIATLLANYTSQNFIEGEYAWNVEKAEMETAAMVTNLIEPMQSAPAGFVDWSATRAGGIFTYGGSGCYLYGVKYALSCVLEPLNSRCTGIRTDGKIFCSQQGHYAKLNSSDWLGLGMENVVDIETDDDTNEMDMEDLKEKYLECISNDVPVLVIICTMGTTDAFSIDPVDEVAAFVAAHPNPAPYRRTIIYCDAVIGWSFLTFRNYDFQSNPLGFSDVVKTNLEISYKKIAKVQYADAIGVDFHKTGWAPYASSMFLVKDLPNFKRLMNRPGAVYLQERTPYNPGLYTLEVSRSAAPALSAWATMRYFGAKGFQSIIGGVLEMSMYLRSRIEDEESMVCVNDTDYGFVTLLRVYPEGVNAAEQYERELSTDTAAVKAELKEYNQLQEDIANMLWWWCRSGTVIDGLVGPHTTYTSGFRTTDYNDDMGDSSAVIYALKSFPMNVNITTEWMDKLLECFKIARQRVKEGLSSELPEAEITEPYNVEVADVVCGGAVDDGAQKPRVTSLLSGVVGSRKKKLGRGV